MDLKTVIELGLAIAALLGSPFLVVAMAST